jgi:hypothetical protein
MKRTGSHSGWPSEISPSLSVEKARSLQPDQRSLYRRTVNPRPAQAWQASVAELLPDSFSFVGLPYGSLRFGQNVMS